MTHETPAEYEASADAIQADHESRAFERSDAAKVAAVAALLEQPTPPRFESKTGNFTGLVGGPENAHRTVGPHRAWSDSSEWCYPDAPCRLCSEPIDQADLRAALADPDAALERVRAEAWDEGEAYGRDAEKRRWQRSAGLDRERPPFIAPNPYRAKAVTS